jgi:hypothetical protein
LTPASSVRQPDSEQAPAIQAFLSDFLIEADERMCNAPLDQYLHELPSDCVWSAEAHGKYTLAEIDISISDTISAATVDSAATRSIMSLDFWRQLQQRSPDLQLKTQASAHYIRTAAGVRVPTTGVVRVPFRVGDGILESDREFLVLDNLPVDLILGLDFLAEEGIALDFKHKRLIFLDKDIQIPLKFGCNEEETAQPGSPLCVVHRRTILPGAQTILDVSVPPNMLTTAKGWATPSRGLSVSTNLQIARSLYDMNDGFVTLAVHNWSHNPVTFLPGQEVARWLTESHPEDYEIAEGVMEGIEAALYASEAQLEATNQDVGIADGAQEIDVEPNSSPTVEQLRQATELLNKLDTTQSVLETEEIEARLKPFLTRYLDFFTEQKFEFQDVDNLRTPGVTTWMKHNIQTKPGARPVTCTPYRVFGDRRKFISAKIAEMLKKGTIIPSNSPWASPVVLVHKPSGSFRMCVNYKRLNETTTRDSYVMPRVTDTLEQLGGNSVYSVVDISSAFHSIPMASEDVPKTAMSTHEGVFSFVVMPFGLANAGATFQRFADAVLAGLRFTTCLVYMDDVICYSKNVDDHFRHMGEVLDRLQAAGLKAQIHKCSLFKSKVDYLGMTVSAAGIEMKESRVTAIREYPRPKCAKEIISFLQMASFFRRFVEGFSSIAHPLRAKANDKAWDGTWTKEMTDAFDTLKTRLCEAPVLAFPIFDGRGFVVKSDASGYGMGWSLGQLDDAGRYRVIQYGSKALTSTQQKYCPYEREALGLITAIRLYDPYLQGTHTTLVTDNTCLKWLLSSPKPSRKLERWRIIIQALDYEIVHRKGKDIPVEDSLSRAPLSIERAEQEYGKCDIGDLFIAQSVVSDTHAPVSIGNAEWRAKQAEDPRLGAMIKFLQGECQLKGRARQQVRDRCRSCVMENGLLKRRVGKGGNTAVNVTIVPEEWWETIVAMHHSTPLGGHANAEKVSDALRDRVWFKGMHRYVRQYVKSCLPCRTRKSHSPKLARGEQRHIVVEGPFDVVGMDILGPFVKTEEGYTHVITFFDSFTRWPEGVLCKGTPTAIDVGDALFEAIISRHSCPTKVLTDRGSQFMSAVFERLSARMGYTHLRTSAYHPNTNGRCEHFHLFAATSIHAFVDAKHKNWHRYLNSALFAYRVHKICGVGFSPFQLLYGREPKLPIDILTGSQTEATDDAVRHGLQLPKDLKLAFEIVKEQSIAINAKNKARRDGSGAARKYTPEFVVGENVLQRVYPRLDGRSRKFMPRWVPAVVVKKVSPTNYVVKQTWSGKEQIVHVQRMLPHSIWKHTQPSSRIQPDTTSTDAQTNHTESNTTTSLDPMYSAKGFGFLRVPAVPAPKKRQSKKRKKIPRATISTQNIIDTSSKRRRTVRPLMYNGMVRGFMANAER